MISDKPLFPALRSAFTVLGQPRRKGRRPAPPKPAPAEPAAPGPTDPARPPAP